MGFNLRNLSVVNYAQGFTIWYYKAKVDTLNTIGTPQYFADAADMLSHGDHIHLTASDGAGIASVDNPSGDTVRLLFMARTPA